MKMMKYFLIIFLVLFLSGCVKYNTEMKINDDNSVELTMTYTLQTQNTDNTESQNNLTTNTQVKKEDFEFLKKYGFSIEDFNQDLKNGKNISGIIIYKKFQSLDEMISEEKITLDFTKIFQEESKLFKYDKFFYKSDGKLNANYIFDFISDEEDNTKNESFNYSEYSDLFDLKYSISFPESITEINSNADEVTENGHKLTWNFELGKQNSVEFSFIASKNITETDKIIILSCLGVIGLSTLIIIIVLLTKISDKKKIEINEDLENLDEKQ